MQADVWRQRRPVNYPKQLEISGGIAAPLLAGFSLATVAQLVIGRNHLWLGQWAILALALAAVLFVNCVQLSALAVGLSASPSERLDYSPEAASDPEILRAVRVRQWEETARRIQYTTRAGICYNGGVLAFLSGLGLVIAPHHWRVLPWGRFVALFVIGIALIVELLWAVTNGKRPEWLLPKEKDLPSVDVPVLPDDGRDLLFPDASAHPLFVARELENLVRLREGGSLTSDEFDRQKGRLLGT